MQKSGIWIPLVASVGVGAATFYSMTKNQQGLGQTMEKMVPFVSQMSGSGNMGMGNNQQMNANSNMQNQNNQNQNSQNLGTFGMS